MSASLTEVGTKITSQCSRNELRPGSLPAGLSKTMNFRLPLWAGSDSMWLMMLPLFGEPDAKNKLSSFITVKRWLAKRFRESLLVAWLSKSISSTSEFGFRVARPRLIIKARVLLPTPPLALAKIAVLPRRDLPVVWAARGESVNSDAAFQADF